MPVVRRLTEGDGLQLVEDTVLQRLTVAVRRDVVAYLADLANGSRADRGAGVVAFNPLLDYPAGTVGARIKAIITGIGAGQPWADVAALVHDLAGQIGMAALSSAVQAEVTKISADVTAAGSVAARIHAASDALVATITQEVLDRAAAVTAAVTAIRGEFSAADAVVGGHVDSVAQASSDRDTALGVRVDTVTARLNTGDIATSLAVANSYAYAKAAADAAIAATANAVRAEFADGDRTVAGAVTSAAQASSDRDTALGTRVDGVSARLNSGGDIATSLATANSYAYTKATVDTAISTASSTLTSAFTGADDAIKARLNSGGDIATSLATALSYAYTKAAADSAISTASSTLTSAFTGADDAIKARLNSGGDIATSLATANSYAYTKAAVDSAISTASTNLTSAFTGADDAIKARLNSGGDIATSLAAANSYAYTKAAADTAVASSVSALRAEISGSGGTIDARVLVEANARATVEAGLLAQYNLKVVATRSDGTKVLGMIGLASTANNVGSQSQIILQADTLSFVPSSNPDAAPVVPMTVGLVNGVTTLIVPAARIGDLTVGTTALANNASSKMVGATVNYSTTAIVTLVINAADIPNGGSTVPVLIIGSTDTFSNPLMDISVYAGAGPGWDGAGSLLAAQPPAGVCCSVHVVNLAAGTYTVACYNHGASSSPYQYDPYTRVRSIACLVAKK